jgi:hypothetical protein
MVYNNKVHYVHSFHDLDSCPFDPVDYSQLKFGSKEIAKKFGYELAESFFAAHTDRLMAEDCVVIASPYNYIQNAATVMTKHFFKRLNSLIINACGKNLEYTTIHRKVSYTADYGFLSKDKRKALLGNDDFYINYDFVIGKTIIFVDDVKITGTHEDKLVEILEENALDGIGHFFLYYANYMGNQPDIESKLNFAGVTDLLGVVDTVASDDYELIIRPIKYLMSRDKQQFKSAMALLSEEKLEELYDACNAEGYHHIPLYQENFRYLNEIFK